LSEAEKASLKEQWNPYGEGYWHELLREATARFRAEFRDTPHVLNIHSGLYHGGLLIIAVNNDLLYPQKASLPESYDGFPVYQFGAAS
jgi:hypothetical protein